MRESIDIEQTCLVEVARLDEVYAKCEEIARIDPSAKRRNHAKRLLRRITANKAIWANGLPQRRVNDNKRQ